LTNALLTPQTGSALNYPRPVVANGDSLPITKVGSSERAPMGSVVTTIFFAEVATYYDGAKDKHPQGGPASTSLSTTMMAAAGALSSTPRGPGIDVFVNYDDGRYQSSRQHP
jgi:hypothetical protein